MPDSNTSTQPQVVDSMGKLAAALRRESEPFKSLGDHVALLHDLMVKPSTSKRFHDVITQWNSFSAKLMKQWNDAAAALLDNDHWDLNDQRACRRLSCEVSRATGYQADALWDHSICWGIVVMRTVFEMRESERDAIATRVQERLEIAKDVVDQVEMPVTLLQIAKVIGGCSKRTLQDYKSRGLLPEPDFPNAGKRGANLWDWRKARPRFEKLFGRSLPKDVPVLIYLNS